MKILKCLAWVIGINKYMYYPDLHAAVNDANNIRQGAIQYTDDMLRSLQNIMDHTMETAKGRFDSFMSSMQSSYDIVTNNRKELSGGLVQQEPEAQAAPQEEKKEEA